ncbi:Co2+/Mg2+ efflux protein ApaG [Paraferrimonas sedimenticola]|uniref:Protein ApaG n=1 Tax=Paraferrimonas sedimenticola TaxID=375674 RepID=A0AA37VZL5_9GAMM|nr:Co2+/Mg2+ efflux protein ApaG [Paraferrimonas sedimenticola]GLP97344.1 protein ApaG [Paraferrimonas sedimenticola]
MTSLLAQDVKISVVTEYVPQQSQPEDDKYLYQYTITIANQGAVAVTLLSRHWLITDGNGKVNEVQGDGVIGKTPTIEPGESFTYTSAAMLETQMGTMQGCYTMNCELEERFQVTIPVFRLAVPGIVH